MMGEGDIVMRLSFIVPTLLAFVSLFFIAIGIWFRDSYTYAPYVGYLLGIIFFLLAGQATGILKNREEEKEKENQDD